MKDDSYETSKLYLKVEDRPHYKPSNNNKNKQDPPPRYENHSPRHSPRHSPTNRYKPDPYYLPKNNCCSGSKCKPLVKVEDKKLRCHTCGIKLDSCCCHDYPGHYMSVETEQCKKEKRHCHQFNFNKYCPKHPKKPFNFFQYKTPCNRGQSNYEKSYMPLAINKHFPRNLSVINNTAMYMYKSGGCSSCGGY